MPGPPPTPTSLKVIRGNPGKRALNKNEPQPGEFSGDPPDYLNEAGRKEWERLVPILSDMKVLTAADYGALANLCLAHQIKLKAIDEMGSGSLITFTAKGGTKADPLVKIMQDAAATEDRILQQFGLTPASRSRIKVAPVKPEQSRWARLRKETQQENAG